MRPNLSAAVPGRYLSFCEREDIAVWRAQDVGVREIARRLGRSPSTISRELRRNASTRTYRLDYRASTAGRDGRRLREPRTPTPRLPPSPMAELSMVALTGAILVTGIALTALLFAFGVRLGGAG